ncbi:hypothetical protein HN51_058218 [Arachis hypogaea]
MGNGAVTYRNQTQQCAQLEQYQKSIDIYEAIACQSLNNNLMKYGVKGHLLNAGICELCKGDLVAINNALERYQELDPTFSGTRIFLLQLKKKMLDTLLPLSRNLITLAGGNAVYGVDFLR